MADDDIYSVLSPNDILSFNQNALSRNPFGIAGGALGNTQLDMRTWDAPTVGVASFGKAFLQGLLTNYAQQDAARQTQAVINSFPQLSQNPGGMATPEGVDESAFGLLRGTVAANNARAKAAEVKDQKKFNSDLLMKLLGKQAEVMGENNAFEAMGQGAAENPNSPAYKVNKDNNDNLFTLRKEFNALEPVKNFAKASQAATALAGALKDKSKVSDQELVRYSILMIEPGMAVREGEQGAVAASQSLPEAWKNQLSSALSGESQLGADVREGIKNLASRAYNSHKGLYDQAYGLYGKEAELQGVDPARLSYIGEAPDAASIFGEVPKIAIPGIGGSVSRSQAAEIVANVKAQYGNTPEAREIARKQIEALGVPNLGGVPVG